MCRNILQLHRCMCWNISIQYIDICADTLRFLPFPLFSYQLVMLFILSYFVAGCKQRVEHLMVLTSCLRGAPSATLPVPPRPPPAAADTAAQNAGRNGPRSIHSGSFRRLFLCCVKNKGQTAPASAGAVCEVNVCRINAMRQGELHTERR